MLKIGITGGIGTGKTTVCKIFELLDIPVFYADDEAKELMVTDQLLVRQIKDTFGEVSYFPKGSLNRKHLSNIVFSDAEALKKLNSFVHPAVFRAMDAWAAQQNAPYVLKEAALLFESGSYQQNNHNILVYSPLDLRVKRVMERNHITKEQVMERMANQFDETKKQKMADLFINNNEQELLIPQVLKIHEQLLSLNK